MQSSTPRKKKIDFTYNMTGEGSTSMSLQETTLEKYLRVHIDNKLLFREHINKSVTKANQMLGLFRSFKFIDKEMFNTLYKSRIRPTLEYGNTV